MFHDRDDEKLSTTELKVSCKLVQKRATLLFGGYIFYYCVVSRCHVTEILFFGLNNFLHTTKKNLRTCKLENNTEYSKQTPTTW